MTRVFDPETMMYQEKGDILSRQAERDMANALSCAGQEIARQKREAERKAYKFARKVYHDIESIYDGFTKEYASSKFIISLGKPMVSFLLWDLLHGSDSEVNRCKILIQAIMDETPDFEEPVDKWIEFYHNLYFEPENVE